jgi:t-SNARE complex subunit (syntaxin)
MKNRLSELDNISLQEVVVQENKENKDENDILEENYNILIKNLMIKKDEIINVMNELEKDIDIFDNICESIQKTINRSQIQKQLEIQMNVISNRKIFIMDKIKNFKNKEIHEKNIKIDTLEYVLNSQYIKIELIHFSQLTKKFSDLSSKYNEKYSRQRLLNRDLVAKTLKVIDSDIDDEKLNKILETGVISTDFNSIYQINERLENLLDLEKSFKTLHELFIDMAILVEVQGEIIDRIETNVEYSREKIKNGKKNIILAKNLQSDNRCKKIFIFIIILIIGMILFIIFSGFFNIIT